ncbi:hypothetical protein [Flavobacterium sharifuzzamanii]|uniref:hypothetical protein n=1 Tax=Flavobacterium sharifuzzamanii TaxID=2211133 RepID=UPI001300A530|nr:hypothetical protein [Flavobacterium sharifuzzamanii]KAF2080468.1 hypothetical protein DMA14_14325 [Flavobacterium sharifuzzamanii]
MGKTITYSQKPVKIDQTYQKDDIIDSNEKLEVKSIIHYSSNYNTSNLWRYKTELEKSDLVAFNVLTNGNIISIVKSEKSIPFVLVLDKKGNKLYKHNIGDGVSKYNFRESWIADNYDGGFTIYVRKGLNLTNRELIGTDDELQNIRYEIEKMTFKKRSSGYVSESISIRDVLLKPIIDKGFTLEANLFSIDYLRNKIFVSGTVKRNNQKEFPFIAILDKNFKLLNLNVFKDYENTFIDDITLYKYNSYYINGLKIKETDLFTTRSLQRFIVNEDLQVIEDHSDKRTPYYDRVHREPTPLEEKMLEKELAVDNNEIENKHNTTYNTRGDSSTVLDSNIFYWDTDENCYFSVKTINSKRNELIFTKNVNEIDLWQLKIKFPKNCKIAWTFENAVGLKRANGEFILSIILENLSSKHLFSTVIFVLDKKGKIIRQFEISGASDLSRIKESNGKLIVNYIHDDGFFINKQWQEHYAFYSECYPLD